jgi:hypothetical protein
VSRRAEGTARILCLGRDWRAGDVRRIIRATDPTTCADHDRFGGAGPGRLRGPVRPPRRSLPAPLRLPVTGSCLVETVDRATGLAVRFARKVCPGREELDTAACAAFRIAEETDFPPWQLTALAAGHAAVATRDAWAVPVPADTSFAIALAEECGRQVRLRVEAAWQAAGAVGNPSATLPKNHRSGPGPRFCLRVSCPDDP